MSCLTCTHAKPLAFAVYCKRDPELRNLPASIGCIIGRPLIQAHPPAWCPLEQPDSHCQACGEVLSLYGHCALCNSRF
jgi:hypothetical protein